MCCALQTYVQNIMADETSNYLFETLHKQKGHMYVCGDVTMAADVSKTLHEIFAQEGKMTVAEAAAAIKEIKVGLVKGQFNISCVLLDM